MLCFLRRERFLVMISLIGSAALGGSAAAFSVGRSEAIVFGLAAAVGVTSTLFRPALQAILPSPVRTPEELIAANGATSTVESLGTAKRRLGRDAATPNGRRKARTHLGQQSLTSRDPA